jgi:pimeloyl-ACP methyl ester carboxylesterase
MVVTGGGLGGDVAGLLRAVALPGSELALRLLTGQRHVRRTIGALRSCAARARRCRRRSPDLRLAGHRRSPGGVAGHPARSHRPAGQRVSAINRLPDAAQIPTLLVCGSRDPIIPVRHAHQAHELVPGSRLAIFPEAGHFPHRHDPARFAELLLHFVHVDRTAVRRPPAVP